MFKQSNCVTVVSIRVRNAEQFTSVILCILKDSATVIKRKERTGDKLNEINKGGLTKLTFDASEVENYTSFRHYCV